MSWTATALADGDAAGVSAAAVVGDAVALGAAVVGAAVGASVSAAVGGAVCAIVGGAVRTGVGGAVGGGVGCGVLTACTTTVPFMNEWMLQWYANVPALVNVNEREAPAVITPVSHVPVSEVDVWLNASRFVHVTVSPTLIVVAAGANAEFWMFTADVAANATSGRASNPHATMRVAAQATAARLTAIPYASCHPRSLLTLHSRRSHATPCASASVWTQPDSLCASGTRDCSSNAIRRST